MGPDTKDKPGHIQDDNWTPGGLSKGEMRDMEARAITGADQDQAAKREARKWSGKFDGQLPLDSAGKDAPSSPDSSLTNQPKQEYTALDAHTRRMNNLNSKTNPFSSTKDKLKINLPKNVRNKIAIGLASATIAGAVAIFGGLFSFLNVFKLDHFLQNVEKRGYMRYQVDLDGRSTKWIQAYLQLRMGEIDDPDPNANIGDRDNLLFRSNRVDNNNPARDWYRTLRTSKFEQEVFEKHGIKFTSVAVKQPDGSVRLRSGMIQLSDRQLTFDVSGGELSALSEGDVNRLNGRIQDFIDITVFGEDGVGGDREARREIKNIVNQETRSWQVIKRYHLRKDIQNMTGVRNWRFFEKTRDKVSEKKIAVRNKIILNSLPEDTKSGKFARCIFGLECPSSSDPANPSNRASSGGGGSGELSGSGESESIKKEFAKKFVNRFLPITNIADTLSTLIKMDDAIEDGSLSKMVVAARGAQALGVFTTYSTMRDQMKTEDVTGEEVNIAMQYANAIGKNDAWSTALSGYKTSFSLGGKAYALEANASSEEEYCSKEYQEKLKNKEVDVNQYAHKCPGMTIGSATNASKFEDWWNNGPTGKYLRPLLNIADTGGILTGIFDFVNGLIGQVTDPALSLFLKTAGLDDDQEKLAEWAGSTVTEELGAGPMLDTDSPSNLDGILAAQGGAFGGESSARQNGAAKTNDKTKEDVEKRIGHYKKERADTQTFAYKYLSLNNPDSIASTQLYALATSGSLSNVASFASSIFGTIGSIPGMLTVGHTNAATDREPDDGYSASRYAEIDTYDYPDECINGPVLMDVTPSSLTNADELGLIPAADLSWDLVTDNTAFYDRLYQDASDDQALEVYNCALLDNVVRGGLGGLYGYRAKNTLQRSGSSTGSSEATVNPGAQVNLNDLGKNSDKIPCAQGTKDLGIVTSRYSGEFKKEAGPMKIRLCQIKDIPGNGNNTSGTLISGGAVVEARVSGAWAALAAKAKQDGVQLSSSSSFRLADSCGGTGNGQGCARPGQSAHQTGWAIDFNDMGDFTPAGSYTSCSGRMTWDSPQWRWMKQNAESFGIKQYSAESWHWDFLPMSNRCGTNDG